MKNLILLITVFLIPNLTLGQSVTVENFKEGKLIGKSKINLGYKTIEVKELTKRDTIIYYVLPNQDISYSVDLSEVESIDKFVSDKSTTGSIIGSLVGVLAGIPIMLATKSTEVEDNMEITTYQVWPMYVTGLVGGGIGYTIGSNRITWEEIYKRKSKVAHKIKTRISPTMLFAHKNRSSAEFLIPGISLSIKF